MMKMIINKYKSKINLHNYSTNLFGLLFSFILLLLSNEGIVAQDFCSNTGGSSPSSSYNASLLNMDEPGPFYLKLYVHIIRDAAGEGGQPDQVAEDAVDILDQDFSAHNIFFIWDCHINYIDDDDWVDGPKDAQGSLNGIYSVDNHSDGLDMYIFPNISNSNGGKANGVGGSSEFWVAGTYAGNSMATTHVTSHEMGHCINLWHTHRSCENGDWEATNGSNCQTAGDLVCDTPADPYLGGGAVNSNTCVWSGSGGCNPPESLNNYNPNTNLIMSYTPPTCMSYFSAGQGVRMRNSIATLPYLQSTLMSYDPDPCNTSGGCPNNLTISNDFSGTDYFEASNSITSTSTINTGANITFDAGSAITLKPDFWAKVNSEFCAVIDGCGANGGRMANDEQLVEALDIVSNINAFPNPLSDYTNIVYTLKHEIQVSVSIYSLAGNLIATLVNDEIQSAGNHQVRFDAGDLPNGTYYYRVRTGYNVHTEKLVIMR